MANIHQGVDSRWFWENEVLRLNWQLQANCRQLVAVAVLLHVGAHLGWGFCALVMNFSKKFRGIRGIRGNPWNPRIRWRIRESAYCVFRASLVGSQAGRAGRHAKEGAGSRWHPPTLTQVN